jgi:lysophospholipase L1-like esterase
MIGASRAMGWGVNYEDRFETLLERRLNDEPTGGAFKHYEILNFSMGGTMPMERLLTFEEKALPFRPDAILYEAGKRDIFLGHHAQMVRRGVAMPYEFLNVIDRKAGIDPSMSESEIVRRLYPYRYELASQVYNHFGEVARERGMPIIWIHIPSMSDNRADVDELRRLAESAGFATLDLSKTYDPAAFRISRWDGHPNPQGHRLIANSIYEHLKTLQEVQRANMDLPQAEAQN